MNKWILVPVILLAALIVVLLINQPKQIPVENVDYVTDSSGDEYLAKDFISPDEIETGELELNPEEQKQKNIASLKGCSELEGEERDWCYSGYSFATGDLEGCNRIEEESTKDGCVANAALMREDPSICSEVKFDKEECYTTIAVDTANPAYCAKGGDARAQCFKAVEKNDFNLCAQTYDKKFCNDAVDGKNPELCNNIVDYSGYCYYEIAKAKNDASICGNISIETIKNQCIFTIATTANNVKLCEQLQETRDNCVAWVAFNTNNKELCLQAGTETQSCLADLSDSEIGE